MQRIMSVQTADAFVLKSIAPLIGVTAAGDVPSTGWTNPQLTPWFHIVPPSDGIQDFEFQAEPPHGLILPVVTPVAAHTVLSRDVANYWGEGLPLRGVRIHGKVNLVIAYVIQDRPALDVQTTGPHVSRDINPAPWPWLAAHPALNGGEDVAVPHENPRALDVPHVEPPHAIHSGDTLTNGFNREHDNPGMSPAS